MRKKVIYHYHENAFVKGRFYRLLAWAMQRLADEIICVSAYQASFLDRKERVKVVPNALPAEFAARLHPDPAQAFDRKTVLMLSSLKEYKSSTTRRKTSTSICRAAPCSTAHKQKRTRIRERRHSVRTPFGKVLSVLFTPRTE